jgi:hypothetical protein
MEMICHSFLESVAYPEKNVTFGGEHTRLPPILEEVSGFSEESTSAKEKTEELLGYYLSNQPAISPVSKLGTASAGNCQHAELVLSSDITALLVKTCHSRGISVTSAVQAAYVRVIMDHADPEFTHSRCTSMNQFNLRSYLPAPYNTSEYAASVYYAPHRHKFDLPSYYGELVESFNKHYKTFEQDPEALEMTGHFKRSMRDVASNSEFPKAPLPKDALVSSLGVVERFINREYKGIKVKNFKFGADIVLGMSMLFIDTFQGKLRLVHSFNDAFESPEDIQIDLKEIQWTLVQELLL